MASEKAKYSHGHHASVVKSHARRTAENSASFLLPHIQPHHQILDIGCGPGSITIGFAKLASKGKVIGGDMSQEVIQQAQSLAQEQNIQNVSFQRFDANALPFPDGSFDITFCHQVLQHVGDPTGVLKEMRRVTKAGGIVAAREADYKGFVWYPEPPVLDQWGALYQKIAKANGAEPNAGRYLLHWAMQAGFKAEDTTFTWDVWNYQRDEAQAFGQSWIDRCRYSSFASSAKQHGLAGDKDLEAISKGWKEWTEGAGSFILIPNGEVVCRV